MELPFHLNSSLQGILITIITFLIIFYIFLYLFQEKLLFFPQPVDSNLKTQILAQYPQAEINISSPDGINLHGWLIHTPNNNILAHIPDSDLDPGPNPDSDSDVQTTSDPQRKETTSKKPLLIYFGGNAEEVSSFILEAHHLQDWAILAINYRGYGNSAGSPSEKHIFNDAEFIYDWVCKNPIIDNTKIVVMGRSLGTGVAIHLASKKPILSIILVSPFDSIKRVAQKIYPFVPVSILLKHEFNSLPKARKLTIPMLALLAEDDRVINKKHSDHLIENWGGPHQKIVIKHSGHNTISFDPIYWEKITSFLNSTTTTVEK